MGKIQSWLWRRIGELQLNAAAPAGYRGAAVIYQWRGGGRCQSERALAVGR